MASLHTFTVLACAVVLGGCFKPSDDDFPADTDDGSTSSGQSDATATNPSGSESESVSATVTVGDDDSTSSVTATATDPTGDPTTDPDDSESSTAPTSADGSSTSTGPASECGNNVVEDGEACDDGVNAGAAPGDCAPDCSTEVEIKEIVEGDAVLDGDLVGAGPGSIIENVDATCPFGYRAMFSDGVDRIATETPNTGDGQVDWVLEPWTAYVNFEGDLLAITDAAALLGVHDGAFSNLTNPITPDDNGGVWTGMNQDWTAMGANENCNNWTNATNSYQMMQGSPGQVTAAFLRQSQDFTYPCSDAGVTRSVYCVEP